MSKREQEEEQTPQRDEMDDLKLLHRALIDNFLSVLNEGKPVKASMLNTIRQYLRDQGINIMSLKQTELESNLNSLDYLDLPFPDCNEPTRFSE